MTPEQTIELAKQAGFEQRLNCPAEWWMMTDNIQRFAELVRNEVLEEAAIKSWSCGVEWHMKRNNTDVREVGAAIAGEIRSMKK